MRLLARNIPGEPKIVVQNIPAVERGEVDGMCADYATVKSPQPGWIEQKKIVALAQFGLTPLVGLEHVPMGSTASPIRPTAKPFGAL